MAKIILCDRCGGNVDDLEKEERGGDMTTSIVVGVERGTTDSGTPVCRVSRRRVDLCRECYVILASLGEQFLRGR